MDEKDWVMNIFDENITTKFDKENNKIIATVPCELIVEFPIEFTIKSQE